MMTRKVILCAMLMTNSFISAERYAYTISPVVDLAGTSWQQLEQKYPFLPPHNCAVTVQDKWHNAEICQRVHQLICHERVMIIREKGDELLIKIPYIFYQQQKDGLAHNTFWAHKKHFIEEASLNPEEVKKLPLPISAEQQMPQETIVLAMPHYAPEVGIRYSAGTRFVLLPGQTQQEQPIKAYAFNAAKKCCMPISIPRSILVPTNTNQRAAFITLAKQWAHLPQQQKIKYVWGGSSFVQSGDGTFTTRTYPETTIRYYEPCQEPEENPKNGLDCSGLIVRAAQSVGIPLCYKNTATMLFNLKQLTSYESLQEGDIIWYPGHVMLIASLEKNTLIEAGSYQSGFGVIHEIPLNAVFKDVTTYQELMKLALEKKPIQRLAKDGYVQKTIRRISFLQLPAD